MEYLYSQFGIAWPIFTNKGTENIFTGRKNILGVVKLKYIISPANIIGSQAFQNERCATLCF